MREQDGDPGFGAAERDDARWRRACASFDAWIDLDRSAFDAKLAQLRAEDPALAADIERLRVADAADGPLDLGVARLAPTIVDAMGEPVAAVAAPTLAAGERVGPFRLLGLLGRGGMGDVYRAERVDAGYVQVVALKLLRPGAESADMVRRFLQERRILAQLAHPGIARLIDGGMAADGRPWLAMELVEGEPITAWAQRHGLGLRARIALAIAVCEAVDYAHRRLVVHRDLKPSNVLVGADGAPRLLDFGIAKLLDDADAEVRTGSGMRLLSPAYAAPEQIAGDAIGIATDVHALGLLLYELFTGELPHGRRTRSLSALAAVVETPPERPSACRRRTTGSQTSDIVPRALEGDLDTIILKALAHAPDRRYRSAAALADDLRRHAEGRPIAARPDTVGYRLGKFVRRHRGGVAVAVASLLAIVVALVLALWQAGVAQREAAAAIEAAARTKRVKDFMMESFAAADPLRSGPDAPQTLAAAVDAALARVDRDFGNDPRMQVDLLDDFGEILTGQGRFDEAEALFRRALALAERTYGPDHPAVAESLLNLASIDMYNERFLQAEGNAARAVAILERDEEAHPLALVNALGALAVVRAQQGRAAEAAELTARGLDIQRRHGGDDALALSAALHNHGTNLLNADRGREAEPLLREALEMRGRALGPEHPTLGYTLSSLAVILHDDGRLDEAAAMNERRVAIARRAFPGPHAWKADALADLGWSRIETGARAEGEALLEESIAIYGQLESPEVLRPLRFLALGRRGAGDVPGALATIDRAWTICATPPAPVVCNLVRANRAGLLAQAGRPAEGLDEADAAIAALEANGQVGDDEMVQAREARAYALAGVGRGADARTDMDAALALSTRIHGDAHPETQRVRAALATLPSAR